MIRLRRPCLFPCLALVGFLAGCTAPLAPDAQCFAEATIDYRAAWRGAQSIRADLARGYALHHQEVGRVSVVPCRNGGTFGSCLHQGRETIALPVAIDRAELTRRLAGLEAKMDALRPAAMKRAAPCGYGDWAGPVPAQIGE